MLHENISLSDNHGPVSQPPICAVPVEQIVVLTSMPVVTSYILGEFKSRHPGIRYTAEIPVPAGKPAGVDQQSVAIVDQDCWVDYCASAHQDRAVIVIADDMQAAQHLPCAPNIIVLGKPEIAELMRVFDIILSGQDLPSHVQTQDSPISVAGSAIVLPSKLTKRETDVFEGIIVGKRYKEIATILGISEATVKIYAYRIFEKNGFRNKHRFVSHYHHAA